MILMILAIFPLSASRAVHKREAALYLIAWAHLSSDQGSHHYGRYLIAHEEEERQPESRLLLRF